MTEFLANMPKECLWYVAVFVLGLFFPQVKLTGLVGVFSRAKGPAGHKD